MEYGRQSTVMALHDSQRASLHQWGGCPRVLRADGRGKLGADAGVGADPHYTVTHRRCRLPELDFPNAQGKGEGAKEGEESFNPKSDAHYVIRGSGPGDEQRGSIVSASVSEYDVGDERRLT